MTWRCRMCPAQFDGIVAAEQHVREVHQVMAFLLSRRLP